MLGIGTVFVFVTCTLNFICINTLFLALANEGKFRLVFS